MRPKTFTFADTVPPTSVTVIPKIPLQDGFYVLNQNKIYSYTMSGNGAYVQVHGAGVHDFDMGVQRWPNDIELIEQKNLNDMDMTEYRKKHMRVPAKLTSVMNLRNPPDDLKALLSKSLSLDKVYLEGSREQVLNVRHGGSEGLLSKKSSVIKHRQELEAFMSDYNKAYPNDKRASAQASFKELNKTIADDNDKIGEIDETLNSDWGDILASRKKFGTQWKQITSACSEFISDEVAPASSSGSTK